MDKRIIFMGTPQIAADVLQALIDHRANVVLVVTQPDRPAGRRNQLQACEVKKLAQAYGIPVFQPESIRRDWKPVEEAEADLIVTCAYGQIVPEQVLDAPAFGCVNLHGSVLPAYRGAAPIQRAIFDGHTKSGMTLMKMDAGMDTGPTADVLEVEIDPDETSSSLFEKMGAAGAELLLRNLDDLLAGRTEFTEQDHESATYAAKISKAEEEIDLSQSDQQIYNQIRALSRVPGGFVRAHNQKLKLLKVRYVPGPTPGAGIFFKEGRRLFGMGGHEGIFYLDEVQPEGRNAMKGSEFMNGKGRNLIGTKAGD